MLYSTLNFGDTIILQISKIILASEKVPLPLFT